MTQEWLNDNIGYVFPVFFVTLWFFVTYWVALVGGWRLLAKRFRATGPFSGKKWHMQSAAMRWLSHYNNALTVGGNADGLFVVPFVLFRAWHPALFVPWVEITGQNKTQFSFFKLVELRLGSSEQIPFSIQPVLAAKAGVRSRGKLAVEYKTLSDVAPCADRIAQRRAHCSSAS
jgi:hypothetical protein